MKSLFLALAALVVTLSVAQPISAQTVNPRGKVAQAVLALNLNHGQSFSVRKVLTNLVQGDYVNQLEGYVKANQPGAYLEVLIDNQVAWQIDMSTEMGTFSIPLKLRNGVDYQSLIIRSVGSSYVDSIEAYIGTATPPAQDEPIPHLPNPPTPVPPTPTPAPPSNVSLAGYCDDADHAQFYAAQNFANSTTGLNLVKNSAVDWAVNYNETHACATIQEYTARFAILRNFAISTNGLNMVNEEAVRYALSRVETTTQQQARELQDLVTFVKSFAVSSQGLNLGSADAASIARQWIDRGTCENLAGVRAITDRYRAEFTFAISSNGLNYDSARAKQYALSKTRRLSACGDLFR